MIRLVEDGISPHLMLLAYLVGDLPDEIFEENVKQSSKLLEGEPLYWGSLKKWNFRKYGN